MRIDIRPWKEADRETLRALLAEPDLAGHFDKFQGPGGLEHKLHDRVLARDGLRLAFVEGEPAGFGVPWLFRDRAPAWAMLRVGVLPRFRRRGVGAALARDLVAFARAAVPGASPEISSGAWMPNPAAAALAASLGFAHERWFWLMERPREGCPAPHWPAGVTVAAFDGGEPMLRDWTDAYNDSFADHFRFHAADLDYARVLAGDPAFRPNGLLLAWRGGAVAGFCRCELHAARGEVGTLGVTRAARGIGLGRALLRWGVRWLAEHQPHRITLAVDGENEGALALYRSEGFIVARSREIWALSPSSPNGS